MANWISWGIVVVSLVHITEEYYGSWINWVQRYAPGVTFPHFVVVNSIFVFLCIAASAIQILLFQLSIASLIFINALIHIVPTFFLKHYSPGVWSAILLYIPLSVLSFYSTYIRGNLTHQNVILSVSIGILIMLIPILAQFIRIHYSHFKS